MELILKPTSRCNFACKFCSAYSSDIMHLERLSSELKAVIQEICPSNIIITGGDPLCIRPDIYEELLSLGSWNLSLTTNLKDYVQNPEKWRDLFKNPRVGICTSFQFGEGRMWDIDTTYDVKRFTDVFDMFLSDIGYRLKFLSVISRENEDRALDHIQLAKKLQTKCKLNPLMPLGKSDQFFPQFKIIQIWLEVFEAGLQDYLDADVQFKHGGCGFNTNLLCSSTIRAVKVDRDGNVVVASCEDDLVNNMQQAVQLKEDPHEEVIPLSQHLTKECRLCRLFRLCHGCHQMRILNKCVPQHCEEMKKLESRILAAGWAL